MKKAILLLAMTLAVCAVPAGAQPVEWLTHANVAPSSASGAGSTWSPTPQPTAPNTRSAAASSSLLDLVSEMLDHVRLTGEGERLALDLRLSRQAIDIKTPMPALDGSVWRLQMTMAIGVARLSSRDPLDLTLSPPSSANTLFLESGLRLEYRPAAAWRLFVTLSDQIRLDATTPSLGSDFRRTRLRPLEVATWARPVTVGIQVRQP